MSGDKEAGCFTPSLVNSWLQAAGSGGEADSQAGPLSRWSRRLQHPRAESSEGGRGKVRAVATKHTVAGDGHTET